MSCNLQIEVDYFIVFIVNTVTCSMSRSICCLSLFVVKLIYLFIYYVSFFAAGYFILVK